MCALEASNGLSPTKRIIAMFPPCRHSEDLRKAANGMIKVNDVTVRELATAPARGHRHRYHADRPEALDLMDPRLTRRCAAPTARRNSRWCGWNA